MRCHCLPATRQNVMLEEEGGEEEEEEGVRGIAPKICHAGTKDIRGKGEGGQARQVPKAQGYHQQCSSEGR